MTHTANFKQAIQITIKT